MRYYIFGCGAAIVAMGIASLSVLPKDYAIGFLQGALTLGGGILIGGFFSIRMQWHGIIAAGILALLGAARGVGNLPGLIDFIGGKQPRGATPILELGVTLISLLLLVKVIRFLQQERLRQMLEAE